MSDLFEGGFDHPTEPEPERKLGADARRTLRQKGEITRGIHPATKIPLVRDGRTCAECKHLILKVARSGSWWKCARLVQAGRWGPDMRKSWPACTAIEPIPKEGE